MVSTKTPVKAKIDFGEIVKGEEYFIKWVIPNAQIVIVADSNNNTLKGGVDPRHVFGVSMVEASEIANFNK